MKNYTKDTNIEISTMTLALYNIKNIIENTTYKIKNFFIRIEAKIEFKQSRKEKQEFNKALNNIINYKLDVKPITKEETLKETKEEVKKEVILNKPKKANDLYKQTLSILNVSEEQLQEYYLNEICNDLENIFYNYQNADINQLKRLLNFIEKYQNIGIERLNEKNNIKINKILSNLHMCLTEQLLNLLQNSDLGYQKVKQASKV
jgi:hypothetical protein